MCEAIQTSAPLTEGGRARRAGGGSKVGTGNIIDCAVEGNPLKEGKTLQFQNTKLTALAVAIAIAAAPLTSFAASLEDEQKSYEQQAQQKKQKSDEIQGQIENFSEVKRQLD